MRKTRARYAVRRRILSPLQISRSPALALALSSPLFATAAFAFAQIDQKKRTLKELAAKDAKAGKDSVRGSQLKQQSGVMSLIPTLTALNMPGVSTEELERNNALAHQLNDFASFEREKTRVDTGTASLRVSPLQGISVAEYVTSKTALQDRLGFASGYLIKACAATGKESGCLPLRELWNLSGGPPGKTHSAQSMIDLLMRAPLVAVRVGVGESFDSSWVIMAKEANTNYKQLATMMSRIQTPSASHSIAKERLRTLTRMASSAADRRLIELAALDQASARKARQLS